MHTYALFRNGGIGRLVFDSFDGNPDDDPVRLVFPDIDDMQVRNSARNGCLAAYHVLSDLRYLHPMERLLYSCQFHSPGLNLQVHGDSAGLAFCAKFVQELYLRRTGTKLDYSIAATGAVSDSTRLATVEPVTDINAKVAAALDRLTIGDLFLYPAGNESELDTGLIGNAERLGIKLVAVSSVAEAVMAILPPLDEQASWPRLARVTASGTIIVCLIAGLCFAYSQYRPVSTVVNVSRRAQYEPWRPPSELDLAARLRGKDGLALAVEFHYLGPTQRGVWSLDRTPVGSVPMKRGDMFKLVCRANRPCYMYAYLIDQHGRIDRLPEPAAESHPPFLQADTTYYFPPSLGDWRRSTAVAASETLYVVASERWADTLEDLYQQYRQVPEAGKQPYSQRLRAALRSQISSVTPMVFATSLAISHETTASPSQEHQVPHLSLWGGRDRQILYVSARNGNSEIYQMNASGHDRTNLTDHPQGDYTPRWSPDGTRILFSTDRDGNSEVYIARADGSDAQNITHDSSRDLSPSWSPDGTRIVFQRARNDADSENFDLYTMDADGSHLRPLVATSFREHQPSWSPDGEWIAYVRSTTFDDQQIYLVRPDGSANHALRPSMLPLNSVAPAWSPDGEHLAFTGFVPGEPTGFYVLTIASGALRQIDLPIRGFDPSYDPGGTHLCFSSSPFGAETQYVGISTCDLRGNRLRQLTPNTWTDRQPSWGDGFRCLGSTEIGGETVRVLNVANSGNDSLQVSHVSCADPQFSGSPGRFELAPGEVPEVTLKFVPTQIGTHYTTLTVRSNDPDDPEIRIIVNGRGLPTSAARANPMVIRGAAAPL